MRYKPQNIGSGQIMMFWCIKKFRAAENQEHGKTGILMDQLNHSL